MICTRSLSWFLTEQEPELRPPNPEPSVLALLLEFPQPEDGRKKASIPNALLSLLPLLSAHRSILFDSGSYSHGKQACANEKARQGEATHCRSLSSLGVEAASSLSTGNGCGWHSERAVEKSQLFPRILIPALPSFPPYLSFCYETPTTLFQTRGLNQN